MNRKKLLYLPIENLTRGQYQPRQTFLEKDLQELAQSIQTHGLLEPLIVRALNHDGHYEIIAGERRWRAAMRAQLQELPCIIGEYTDAQTATIALIENIQREDLSPLEEANAYHRLKQSFHFKQDEIATLVGKSRPHIANLLRLLSLCDAVQTFVQNKQLTTGHARLLIGLPEPTQKKLAQLAVSKQWSVRTLEQQVRHETQPARSPSPAHSPQPNTDLLWLQTKLSEHVGSPVEITAEKNHSGWVKLKYYDDETLSGLLEKLGLHTESEDCL